MATHGSGSTAWRRGWRSLFPKGRRRRLWRGLLPSLRFYKPSIEAETPACSGAGAPITLLACSYLRPCPRLLSDTSSSIDGRGRRQPSSSMPLRCRHGAQRGGGASPQWPPLTQGWQCAQLAPWNMSKHSIGAAHCCHTHPDWQPMFVTLSRAAGLARLVPPQHGRGSSSSSSCCCYCAGCRHPPAVFCCQLASLTVFTIE